MSTYLPAWLAALAWASLCGTLLAAVVGIVALLASRKMPARWLCVLWLLVLARFVPWPLMQSRWAAWQPVDQQNVSAPMPPASDLVREPLGESPILSKLSPELPAAVSVTTPHPSMPMSSSPVKKPAETASYQWVSTLLVSLYLLGACIVFMRLLMSTRKLRQWLTGAMPAPGPAQAILDEARSALAVSRPIRLMLVNDISSPAIVGIWRPWLVMSTQTLAHLSPEELRLVCQHECAHVRRNDVALNYLIAAVTIAHWFNPVVWLIAPRIRAAREWACDETVLAHTNDAPRYGETLLKLFETTRAFPTPASVGIVESHTFFTRRIRMIATFRKRSAWAAITACIALAALTTWSLTRPVTAASPADSRSTSADDTPKATPSSPGPAKALPSTTALAQQIAETDSHMRQLLDELQETQRNMLQSPKGAYLERLQQELAVNKSNVDSYVEKWKAAHLADAQAASAVALARTIKELHVDHQPLQKVLAQVRDTAKVNMVVKWEPIKDSVDDVREYPISLDLTDVPLRKVLRLILDQLPGRSGLIDFSFEDNVLTISSAADLRGQWNNATPPADAHIAASATATYSPNAAASDTIRERWSVQLKQIEAADLAKYLQKLFKDEAQTQGISIGADSEKNSLLIVAPPGAMKKIRAIVTEKDGGPSPAATENTPTRDAIAIAILEDDEVYKSLRLQLLQAEQDNAAARAGGGSNSNATSARVDKIREQMIARRNEVASIVNSLSDAQLQFASQQMQQLRGMMTDVMDRTLTPLLNRVLGDPKEKK